MRFVTLWLVPVVFASSMACSSSGNQSTGNTAPSPAEPPDAAHLEPDPSKDLIVAQPRAKKPADAPPLDATPLDLEGRLIHTPLPAEKSVEAYLGVEFKLRIANRHFVLSPSDKVTRADLLAAKDTEVKLTCIMRRGSVPDHYESYPTEPDGSPMKRPDTCQVTSLTR